MSSESIVMYWLRKQTPDDGGGGREMLEAEFSLEGMHKKLDVVMHEVNLLGEERLSPSTMRKACEYIACLALRSLQIDLRYLQGDSKAERQAKVNDLTRDIV